MTEHREKLALLASLEDDYSGCGGYGGRKPNALSLERAALALDLSEAMDFSPSGVVPSGEDGVGIIWRASDKYGDIEFFNDGGISAATQDRSGAVGEHDPVIWDVEPNGIPQALERICRFFGGLD